MARRSVQAWEEPRSARKKSVVRTTVRAMGTTFVLMMIAYMAGLVIGRTDGFRSIVAERLGELLGQPVKVERVSLGLSYALTVEGIVTEGTRRLNSPGVRIGRLRAAPRWSDVWRRGRVGLAQLEIEKAALVFERDEEGRWAPEALAGYAELLAKQLHFSFPPPEAVFAAPAAARDASGEQSRNRRRSARPLLAAPDPSTPAPRIAVRRGEIAWWVDNSAPFASVEGLAVSMTPLEAPGRRMIHYRIDVKRAASRGGQALRDASLELLDIGDQRLVLRFTAEHFPSTGAEEPR